MNTILLDMGISELFSNYYKKKNIAHFANIVRIAKSDNTIDPEELQLLKKIAKKYNIEEAEYKDILKQPDDYPTLGSIEEEERIERLYDLIMMVDADHNQSIQEIKVLRKIVTGLSFPLKRVDAIIDLTLKIDIENCDLEQFKQKILKLTHSS
ncbi:tellurite resistance TerB family protein [Namhaeicola litoreus]|uniref:TerB family tellurite resistance protein n=1 Tax=Namhaeicola litoreus TaxID=1052145 RepID=A0ABW3Y0M1_9FLAO